MNVLVISMEPGHGATERDGDGWGDEEVYFSVGNPSVETIRGVLRLFRPVQRERKGGKVVLPPAGGDDGNAEVGPASRLLPHPRSSTICLLALPPSFIPADAFKFFGAFLESVHKIRFVRQDALSPTAAHEHAAEESSAPPQESSAPPQDPDADGGKPCPRDVPVPGRTCTSCILDFRSQESADDFFLAYDGRKYSSLEEDVCRCIFVRSCELFEGSEPRAPPTQPAEEVGEGVVEVETEMPTCPVCLERLDAHITGIATTMCNHDFHPQCLMKCTTASCPVCRYSQVESEDVQRTRCQRCGGGEDLWICVVCGHVGCGRYAGGHARTHWLETGHCYAMELQSQRVWDYVGDEYVHRLIRSKVDGQHYLVEVPATGDIERPSEGAGGRGEDGGGSTTGKKSKDANEDVILASKLEAITLEYNHLLMAQLGSQTEYFEGKLQEMRHQVALEREMSDAALNKARHLEATRKEHEAKVRQEFERENAFLRDLNESVLRDKDKWRDEVERARSELRGKDERIRELQDQVRDLAVYLEAQSMVAQHEGLSEEDRREATVSIGEGGEGSGSGRNATHARLKNKLKMKRAGR